MSSSRRQYPFHLIEPKWQQFWDEQQTFRAFNPGEVLPDGHPFARRQQLSGKVAATQLPIQAATLPYRWQWAQLAPLPNPDTGFGKERRVHAAAWQKGSLCRLKPAFLGGGAKRCPVVIVFFSRSALPRVEKAERDSS